MTRSRRATVADLHALAGAMPGVTVEAGPKGNEVYQVSRRSFVYFRTPRPDAPPDPNPHPAPHPRLELPVPPNRSRGPQSNRPQPLPYLQHTIPLPHRTAPQPHIEGLSHRDLRERCARRRAPGNARLTPIYVSYSVVLSLSFSSKQPTQRRGREMDAQI